MEKKNFKKEVKITNLLDYWKVEFADAKHYEYIKQLLTNKHYEIKIDDLVLLVRGNKAMREVITYCIRNSIDFEVVF